MATSTRRRKPAAPDAPVSDTLTPDTAAAPPSDAPASPEPAAEPPKRPRAPRKTPAARKRAGAVAATAEADAAVPADEALSEAPAAVEPPVDTAADTPAEAPAPRAPRPRRKRETTAATEPAPEPPAAEAAVHVDAAVAAPDVPAPAAEDEAIHAPPPRLAPEDDAEPAQASDAPPEPPPAPAPAPPPLPPTSRLAVDDDGLQRRLRWQTGARCPETLSQALRRWQLGGLDGPLPLTQVDDLAELLAMAERAGHEVEVEPAVWAHLARLGDLQGRIAHLESRHPQGLDPAAQPEGSLLAGWRACQLEAAFFAACVGRCVLADEPALQPEAELLLAARLVMQHFGASVPVVLAPAEAHAGWQAAWAQAGRGGSGDAVALTLLTPEQAVPAGAELLLLDQRTGLAPAQAETPAAQAAAWLWVLAPADLLGQPGALPLLAAVDQLRQGGLATWQRDGDAEALAPLLLARRFDDVAVQWPAWQPVERSTPARAGEGAYQAQLAQRLARWQRSGFLADSDQLALRQALQAAWAGARAANAAALPALLREALTAGAGRIVVFSEDAAILPALADALRAEGLPADALPTAGAPRLADQALRAFREAPEPRILLAADGPGGDGPRIGVQLAPPLVIHLDTPWAAGTLGRRLQRVRTGPAQREVPVWQLLPEGSLMARRARALPAGEAAPATAPATALGGALLRGPALAAWQAEIAAVAEPPAQPDAPT